MKIPGLKNKILLGAVAIAIVVAVSSLLAASWVIARQYHEQSNEHLRMAAQVIGDSLADRKAALAEASRKLTTQRNLGSTIWYLSQYAQANVEQDLLLGAYRQLAGEISAMGSIPELSQVAVYDSSGRLVSFVVFGAASNELGFVEHAPTPVVYVATLMPGEEFTREKLKIETRVNRIEPLFDGPLPQKDRLRFTVVDGLVAIESAAPVMGEAFDPATGKSEVKQLGLVRMVQPLGRPFIDRMAKLTDTAINIFTPAGLTAGHMAAYRNLDRGGSEAAATPELPLAASITEVTIDGTRYYQGQVPLYNEEALVGTIVSLRSQDIVQGSIWAMTKALGLIAASSLLLILPLSWYFATSLARPLSVLARVFRGVASDQESAGLRDELDRLARGKARDDELGDLTQSFVAMEQAIAQKILQISELNSSLEKKVQERTAALMTSEQELRTVLDNTPDTIARYDGDGRRIYVNPAFGALAEGGEAQLLGKKPSEFPGGADSVLYEAKILEVFNSGHDEQFELKWANKDGTETCSHIRLRAERDPSGAVASVLAVGRDITEVSNYRNQLVQKERAKTRFLAAAGHDLRQPLAAASLFVDTLKSTALTAPQEELVGLLDQAMGTVNGLLDALLNVSKLDSGTIKPEYLPIDVEDLFVWVEQSFAHLAAKKNLSLRYHFPLEPLIVASDISLLKSALLNLVSNAIKYTVKGGVLIGVRRRADEALFQIWDTGIGISPEHIGQVFDEFYQIDNPRRDRTEGLGLGLSIVKRALTLLNVDICCRSRVGHGTVMEFRLPLAPRSAKPASSVAVSPTIAASERSVLGKRFILVEDDALLAKAMTSLLESMGGTVTVFSEAEAALTDPTTATADYFISDYRLGGAINGLQFLIRIQAQAGKPIFAVLVTGDTSPAFIGEAVGSPWPVLYKPVNVSKLMAALQTAREVAA